MYPRFVKRILDILLALTVLPFVAVVIMVSGILIYAEDKGPVFYLAARMGKDKKPFMMYKLRTMYVNAPDLRFADGSTYNAVDDPRMTRVGRFLRKSSIDELPQVINVLKGDMSFIGPRPDDLKEAELYQGDESLKLDVLPGISGYAQVYGRNAISWRERLVLDVEYVQRIGFLLDMRIFFRTFLTVFSQSDVYAGGGSQENPVGTIGPDQPGGVKLDRADGVDSDLDDGVELDQADGVAPDRPGGVDNPVADAEQRDATVARIGLVSLVVVAYNEEHYLPQLLEDIIAQDFPHPAIEVLLIDSNAGGNIEQRQQMQDFALSSRGFNRIEVIDNPKASLPAGCNVALGLYRGDALIRIDAHARIPSNFVSCNVAVLEEGHQVCGGIRPVTIEDPTAWARTLLAAESSAFGASAATYRRAVPTPQMVDSVFHGAYRREVLDVVGAYDERLVRTEDNDYSTRVRAAGFQIFLDPRICSKQYLRPSLSALLGQKNANGYWIGRTLWIKPQVVSLIHMVPFCFVVAVLAALLIGVFATWWPGLVLVAVYAAADAVASIQSAVRSKPLSFTMLALPLVFLSMHLSYGFGTFCGLLSGLVNRLGLAFKPRVA